MNQKQNLIIGLGFALVALAPALAHAQDLPSANCMASLYGSQFACDSANIRSFCSPTALASETPDAIVDMSSALAYYKSSYCNVQRDSDDEIIAAVTEQMKVEDPKWNEDLLRSYLSNASGDTLIESVGGASKEQKEKLPATLVEAYIDSPDVIKQEKIFDWVRSAYDKEKVMAQSKSSLKQQFKGREMWANGTLSDAPFDLIVDLNLLEIVMFGSQAKWMDDVYKFPKQGSAGIGGAGAGAGGGAAAPSGAGAGAGVTETGGSPGTGGATPSQPQNIKCVSEIPPGTVVIPGTEPGKVPPNCGNGKVDEGEECDDGNTKAGDGCGESCKNEPGNTLSCKDPEAVTFKPFVPKPAQAVIAPTGPAAGNAQDPVAANVPQGGVPIDCPPGTTPTVEPPKQSPNYPGPDVGGVLKEFPPSNKPDCPAGMSLAEISFADPATMDKVKVEIADNLTVEGSNPLSMKSSTVSRCVPTSACGSFEEARKLLFGENYSEDKAKVELAASIEAFVCIKVLKVQRPESPYPVNEGCIDCHILGMNDAMSKLLENNVSCLKNNMQAWGLSSRGPKVAFNLDVVQGMGANWLRRKLGGQKPDLSPAEKTQLRAKQIGQDAAHKLDPNRKTDAPTVSAVQETSDILNRDVLSKAREKSDIALGLKFYRAASESENVDQQFHGPVSTMLEQMLNSFERLQSLYVSLATGSKFKSKEECPK